MESNARDNNQKAKLLPKHEYFWKNFRRFLLETSLNGLKYIADVHRNIWERGYYLISFSIVFTCGLYMVLYFLQKWQNTPVIISIGSKTVSIQDLPFPAVTVCNMNQALASKVKDIHPDTPEYAMLQAICFQKYNYSSFKNFKPRFQDDTFINFKVKNSQNCSDMLMYCKFGAKEEPCTNLFREVVLDEGICCIFNRLNSFYLHRVYNKFLRDYTSLDGQSTIPVNWSLETGYEEPLPKSYYPRRAAGSGVSLGLTVVMNANIDEYYCSSTNGAGFKILLTNAADSADIKEVGLPIMLGHQTRLRINTKRLESEPSLHQIKPKNRQCYFVAEKILFSYKYYTRRFCEAECNAKQILRHCKCVPYYMPDIADNVTKCFLAEMDCVANASSLLQSRENLKCKEDCLPGCNDLSYYPDLYATPLSGGSFKLQSNFFHNISAETMQKNLAIVDIFYRHNNFRPNTKLPYTGLTEFLSQSGGIMGLMLGFSVISIFEIFYFVLLKPFIDIFLKRNPSILESKDLDEVKEESALGDKYHKQVIFKRRKRINNRIMNWGKDELQKYRNEKY